MLILATICYLSSLTAQSKKYCILKTGGIFIGLLVISPLLLAIAHAIIPCTPCRKFKQCWLKLSMNHGDPELESQTTKNKLTSKKKKKRQNDLFHTCAPVHHFQQNNRTLNFVIALIPSIQCHVVDNCLHILLL